MISLSMAFVPWAVRSICFSFVCFAVCCCGVCCVWEVEKGCYDNGKWQGALDNTKRFYRFCHPVFVVFWFTRCFVLTNLTEIEINDKYFFTYWLIMNQVYQKYFNFWFCCISLSWYCYIYSTYDILNHYCWESSVSSKKNVALKIVTKWAAEFIMMGEH